MRTLVLVLATVLAGCVSLTPQQEDKVAEIQRFADRATEVYGKPRVRVTIQPATNLNIGAFYRQGNFFINVRMLDSANLTKLVAHELAHYILGHDGFIPGAVSQAEWTRGQQQRELDANAKAVEILVRAEGADGTRGGEGRSGCAAPIRRRAGTQQPAPHAGAPFGQRRTY
jgi:Zn-dependent peptidase ImmA (M78 family)